MKRLVAEGADVSAIKDEQESSPAVERVRKRRAERRRRKTVRKAAIVCGVIGVIAGIYAWGFSFFSDHYYPGTSVFGIDASYMDEASLVQAIDDHVSSYVCHVSNGDFEMELKGEDVSLSCDAREVASEVMSFQDASCWLVDVFGGGHHQEDGLTFDEKSLTGAVEASVGTYNRHARAPKAATLALDSSKHAFHVIAEVPGTTLDAPAVVTAVSEAVSQGSERLTLTDVQLVPPAHVADSKEMKQALKKANATLSIEVGLTHKGEVLMSLEPATFVEWLTVHDDLSLGIDADEAAAWADSIAWKTFDYADENNVCAMDGPAFASALDEAIAGGKSAKLEVTYVVTPRYLPEGGSLAKAAWDPTMGRYLDVDKGAQVACLFDKDGSVLWETIVTTGNEASADGTPVGEFAIYDKVSDFVLIGRDMDYDGKPDYENHVDYWMPFYGGIGLHDASWRDVYGGSEYLEHGSGGCVNLPHDAAQALFAITHVDEVVLVHT